MVRTLGVAALVLFGASCAKAGDAPASKDWKASLAKINARVLEIELERRKAMEIDPGAAMQEHRLARRETSLQLWTIIFEVESIPADQWGFEEHEALADAYFHLHRTKWDKAMSHAKAAIAIKPDAPETHAILVGIIAQDGSDVDEAERAFAEANRVCTDKAPLVGCNTVLSHMNLGASRPQAAADHIAVWLASERPLTPPTNTKGYTANLHRMCEIYIGAGATDKALNWIARELPLWEAIDSWDARTIANAMRTERSALLAIEANYIRRPSPQVANVTEDDKPIFATNRSLVFLGLALIGMLAVMMTVYLMTHTSKEAGDL